MSVSDLDEYRQGWEVYTTDSVAPATIHLRLEPSEVTAVQPNSGEEQAAS